MRCASTGFPSIPCGIFWTDSPGLLRACLPPDSHLIRTGFGAAPVPDPRRGRVGPAPASGLCPPASACISSCFSICLRASPFPPAPARPRRAPIAAPPEQRRAFCPPSSFFPARRGGEGHVAVKQPVFVWHSAVAPFRLDSLERGLIFRNRRTTSPHRRGILSGTTRL